MPRYAIKAGLLSVEKKGKIDVFSGKVLEIEGLPDLKVEQAFELSDAAAERFAAACAIALNKEPIVEYMRSNITTDEVDDRRRLLGCPHPEAPHQVDGRVDRQR